LFSRGQFFVVPAIRGGRIRGGALYPRAHEGFPPTCRLQHPENPAPLYPFAALRAEDTSPIQNWKDLSSWLPASVWELRIHIDGKQVLGHIGDEIFIFAKSLKPGSFLAHTLIEGMKRANGREILAH
jgi:hypothetical protein